MALFAVCVAKKKIFIFLVRSKKISKTVSKKEKRRKIVVGPTQPGRLGLTKISDLNRCGKNCTKFAEHIALIFRKKIFQNVDAL